MSDQFQHHSKPRPHCAERHLQLASGANVFDDVPDAIRCIASGAVTITDAVGTAIAYTATAGELLPFRARAANVSSGTFAAWWF